MIEDKHEKLQMKSKERAPRRIATDVCRLELQYFKEHGYHAIGEVGKGGYGTVYIAHRSDQKVLYAIKMNFGTVRLETIYTELLLMTIMQGSNFLIGLVDMFKHGSQYHLVTNYFPHVPFIVSSVAIQALLQKFQLEDIRYYLYSLLKGLSKLKGLGIYHRDIKPSNFLYNPSQQYGIITDFGLSEIDQDYLAELEARVKHEPTEKLSTRVQLYREVARMNSSSGRLKFGTELYMPLETLLKWERQSYSSDVWPVGVIFLQFIMKKFYVFNSFLERTDCSELKRNERRIVTFLMELASLFGNDKVKEGCECLGVKVVQLPEASETQNISIRNLSCIELDEHGEDLLRRLMDVNPRKRITADEALRHEFFRSIRNRKKKQ